MDGSFSALKLSRDMPKLPSTVLPSSFSLPAQAMACMKSNAHVNNDTMCHC